MSKWIGQHYNLIAPNGSNTGQIKTTRQDFITASTFEGRLLPGFDFFLACQRLRNFAMGVKWSREPRVSQDKAAKAEVDIADQTETVDVTIIGGMYQYPHLLNHIVR